MSDEQPIKYKPSTPLPLKQTIIGYLQRKDYALTAQTMHLSFNLFLFTCLKYTQDRHLEGCQETRWKMCGNCSVMRVLFKYGIFKTRQVIKEGIHFKVLFWSILTHGPVVQGHKVLLIGKGKRMRIFLTNSLFY